MTDKIVVFIGIFVALISIISTGFEDEPFRIEKKHFDGPFKTGPKLEKVKSILIENNYELLDLDKENILAKKVK